MLYVLLTKLSLLSKLPVRSANVPKKNLLNQNKLFNHILFHVISAFICKLKQPKKIASWNSFRRQGIDKRSIERQKDGTSISRFFIKLMVTKIAISDTLTIMPSLPNPAQPKYLKTIVFLSQFQSYYTQRTTTNWVMTQPQNCITPVSTTKCSRCPHHTTHGHWTALSHARQK